MPSGQGPFPAVVDLRPRSCEGPAGIPPGWEQTTLPSWGYAVLAIDSVAARGLAPRGCQDIGAVGSRQIIGDAYSGLDFLAHDGRIDTKRVALLGFRAGVATATILSDTTEARETFSAKDAARFRAFFAISPYCNVKFAGHTPQLYAPARVFAGEKDDFDPADRCVQLAESFRAQGSDFVVTVYPDARAGFDITPPDTNYPLPDRTAMHPGGVTVSTHPQYDPWATNLANCTVTLKSVFDTVDPSGLAGCTRRGAHFQENAETAAQLQNDLRRELNVLLSE